MNKQINFFLLLQHLLVSLIQIKYRHTVEAFGLYDERFAYCQENKIFSPTNSFIILL